MRSPTDNFLVNVHGIYHHPKRARDASRYVRLALDRSGQREDGTVSIRLVLSTTPDVAGEPGLEPIVVVSCARPYDDEARRRALRHAYDAKRMGEWKGKLRAYEREIEAAA